MEFTRDRETESVIPSRVILGDYKFGRKVAGIECEHRTVRGPGDGGARGRCAGSMAVCVSSAILRYSAILGRGALANCSLLLFREPQADGIAFISICSHFNNG